MIRVRFAPSPTGIPHIGNTRTALYNYLFAKNNSGKFILRIEDTDRSRLVPESLEKILEILQFVGINWDEGPKVGGEYGPYIQSQRLTIYKQHAKELVKKKHAYYCFCSPKRLDDLRKLQQKQGKQPRYDRHCLNLPPNEIAELRKTQPFVIRLLVPKNQKITWADLIQGKIEFDSQSIDDQVLLKSDGYPTYHLGVVVDDHFMRISHILRGSEWISSTPKHLLLYQAFSWEPPKIGHFSVILGPDKAKLSKRHGAKSALDYRDEGYLPEALISFMAYLGWSYQDNSELLSLKKLTKLFSLKHIHQTNPIFDLEKLNYFNGKAIRSLSTKQLLTNIKPFIPKDCSPALTQKILPLIQERLVKLSDFETLSSFFYRNIKIDQKLIAKQSKKSDQEITKALKLINSHYSEVQKHDWTAATLELLGRKLVKKSNWNARQLFMTIRVATTGELATPPLFDTLEVLGKQVVIDRLTDAQEVFK